jgi:thiamine pyrophosphate-dependent acetolactate synthase large subunit-like protein
MNGGEIIAQLLRKYDVDYMFTLCGGHISPIFVGAEKYGIEVVDTRHEANAVFAADAYARLTGKIGVAAVTAGPGVTNTITAIKNAQMAQSPVLLLGGAAATVLKGRGSLQDIEQLAVMRSITKYCVSVKKVKDFVPTINTAIRTALEGTPGPVFVECPIDLLYDEEMVKSWYLASGNKKLSFGEQALQWYLTWHVNSVFEGAKNVSVTSENILPTTDKHLATHIRLVKTALEKSQKPLMLIGSGSLHNAQHAEGLADAVRALGIPVYLSGMGRGLLSKDSPLQQRHNRRQALKQADLIILAGVPCDFRLDYGRHLSSKAQTVFINANTTDLFKNKTPDIAVNSNPALFLMDLAKNYTPKANHSDWFDALAKSDAEKEANIAQQAKEKGAYINPIELFKKLDTLLPDNVTMVADGGDFVATASYILKPRHPLAWLDPGVFGTLGVGGGFALGAKIVNSKDEIWVIYGDGSSAFSIAEIDTMVRHKLPAIILIGNDASWAQIARDQVDILKSDVATVLAYSNYEKIGEAFGAKGRMVTNIQEFTEAVKEAQESVKNGVPFVINALLNKSDFRKGSISV